MNERVQVPPMDRYNKRLVDLLAPPDWVNPEPAEKYNLVVVGGGPGGLVVAAGAAGIGAKVALVERHLLGGDCSNVGCVPSKCLIRSARAAAEVRRAPELGIRVPDGMAVDFPAVMERMRRIRAELAEHDSAARFRDLGVDVFLGEGRFAGASMVEVDGKRLRFHRAVIATGARAVRPAVPGLDEAGFLTNETVFTLTELPRRLVVFGAGPLGCELAQAFRRFGSEVTIIERQGQFLSREDPDAVAIIERAFEREGVRVLLSTEVVKVSRTGEEKQVLIKREGREEVIGCEEILIGAGRQPNVDGLSLEKIGVEHDPRTGVKVDEFLRTTSPHVYAVGDVCLPYKFTHMADATARIVIQNALFPGHKKLSTAAIPWCTYTDPEIAHVGLYERDAAAKGMDVDTFLVRMDEVDRAVAESQSEGMVKIHVEKGRDRIVGATIVAAHAGEMVNEITLAMANKIGLGAISAVIHPYPTQAEAIRKAADAYNRTRLKPWLKGALEHFLAWER